MAASTGAGQQVSRYTLTNIMNLRKRAFLGVSLCFLAIGASAVYVISRDRTHNLVAVSRSVLYLGQDTNSHDYVWVSDHAAIEIESHDSATVPYETFRAFRLDISAGIRDKIDALTPIFARDLFPLNAPAISPGGTSLLVSRYDNDAFHEVADIYDLRGTKLQEWRRPAYETKCLMPLRDGTGWMEFCAQESGTPVVSHPLAGQSTQIGNCPDDGRALGEDCYGDFVTYIEEVTRTTSRRITTYSPNNINVPKNTYVLPIPANIAVRAVKLSPNGDRLLFLTRSGGELYPILLRRLLAGLRQARHPFKTTMWTCKLDGSQMREIGAIYSDRAREENLSPAWRCDGQSVSFLYNGWLRCVPAP